MCRYVRPGRSLLSRSKRGVCEDASVVSDRTICISSSVVPDSPQIRPRPEMLGVTCDLWPQRESCMSRETVLLRWLAAVAVLSLLVAACGSPSGSATTTTTVSSADSSTVADQSTLETVQPSSTSQPTKPPISASTTSGSTTTVKPTTTTTAKPTTTTTAKPTTTTTAKPTTTTTAEPTTTTAVQTSKTVAGSIVSFAFNPNQIVINVGDTVTWTNNDPVDHTTTSAGNWNSGSLTFGASFSEVFDSPGTFNYFCSIHPSMTATVVVNP